MPIRRRAPVGIFNFSFVDILATTIGVIIFIMVLALLNSSARFSVDKLKAAFDRAQEEMSRQEREVASLGERIRQEAATREALRRGAEEATKDLKAQEIKGEELRNERSMLLAKKEELSGRLEREEGRRKEVEGLLAQVVPPAREEVPFRLPLERETTKKPVLFECDGDRVYLTVLKFELNKDDYGIQPIPMAGAAFVTRHRDARGEAIDDAINDRSRFRGTLRQAWWNECYLVFLVRSDSFKSFRRLRQFVWDMGYDVNWEPMEKGAPMVFGTSGGGGRGTVQ